MEQLPADNPLASALSNANRPPLGSIALGKGSLLGSGSGGSILDRLAKENSKENQLDSAAFAKSEYAKDKIPTRGILRKADDSTWEKLQSKFSSLEGELLSFSTQTQVRRDSLNGRMSLLQAPAAPLAPAVTLRDPAAALQKPAAALQPMQQPAQQARLEALCTSTMSAMADAAGAHHDDTCAGMGSSGASKGALISVPVAENSKAAKAAAETFEDPGLQSLCSEGLHKKLLSTKDGATDKSRIIELADLVKLLRKCVKEMGSRATMYIDQCIKIEREGAQQVEAVKLSSQTTLKQLEAELASTRQSLAEYERDYRNDKAKWGSDLETQRGEVARLLRELERLTDERDRARDEAKRSEQTRQQLEGELKDLRKNASQQMRDLSVNQSEAVRMLTEERIAADNKITSLREEHNRTLATLKAAQGCVADFEQENNMLRASVENLKDSLAGKEAASAVQSEQIAKLHKDLAQSREQLAALTAAEQELRQEAERSAEERADLAASLEQRVTEVQQLREQLRAQEQRAEQERTAWEAERAELKASLEAAAAEQSSLSNSMAILKTALGAAMAKKDEAEAKAAQEAVDRAALMREHTNLQHQMEFAESRQAQLEQEAAAVRARMESIQTELEASKQLLDEKDGRLVHLEGEFAALKEVLGETAAAAGEAGGSKDIVATLLSKIATLQNAAAAAEAVRRKLHNELVDLRGNIRVYCRVRPHAAPSTRLAPDGASIHLAVDGKEHTFSYDRVFGPDSSQENVFGAVSELVQSALDGFHVCIFSYGQTGAGKTHTMQGGESPASRGIIPRAVDKILTTARKLEEQAEWSYTMEASFIEIYNNQLRDLLGTGPAASSYINDLHAIKHDPDGGHTIVSGVSKVPVTDSEGAAQLVRRAAAARAVEATAMNSVSSRSHSVFMLYISGWHANSGTRLQGCLCLVDLAGSERLDRSLAEGQAKKEACAINASLSALGDVFSSLSSKNSHVPYRNSKLTYLLQPCLGGSGKTLMFVNINPEPASAGESLCSLRFAAKVSGCETGAKGGARRNVMQLGGGGGSGDAGPSGNLADPSRPSLSGLPRPPAGGVDAASVAAAKRMSMLPQRAGGDTGAGRMSLAGARPGAAGSSAIGQKRPAAAPPGNAPKRTRP